MRFEAKMGVLNWHFTILNKHFHQHQHHLQHQNHAMVIKIMHPIHQILAIQLDKMMHQILKQEKLFMNPEVLFHILHLKNHNAQQENFIDVLEKGTSQLAF